MKNRDWEEFNCYIVLDVSPSASPEEIKSAWKRASLIHHPDRGGSEEEQKKINHAYRILSDPIQRQRHDEHWIEIPGSRAKTSSEPKRAQEKSAAYTNQYTRATDPSQIFRGLKQRVLDQIEREKKRILEEIDDRIRNTKAELNQALSKNRQEALFAALIVSALGYVSYYFELQCVWILVAYFGWALLSSALGVKVSNHEVSIFIFGSKQLDNVARKIAQESCDKDIAALQQSVSILKYLSELLSRRSTLNDSEEHVAQRLAVSFFLMGYKPSSYDRENRVLRFLDGDSKFLVRFRHRSGAPTNIAYVEKLVSEMKYYRVSNGFLFCSSSISRNAANYAGENNIRWYTLETMNSWIAGVLASDRSGPEGNILDHLKQLKDLVDSIVPEVATRLRSAYSRYRRYRY